MLCFGFVPLVKKENEEKKKLIIILKVAWRLVMSCVNGYISHA
jgi:hypothetical protein